MSNRHLKPCGVTSVSAEAMHLWAELLGDPNPIHLDREVSAALGFGEGTVNQGPANLAYVMNMLADNFPTARLVSVEAQFLGNVLSGDQVEATGEWTHDGKQIACAAVLNRNGSEDVLRVAAKLEDNATECPGE